MYMRIMVEIFGDFFTLKLKINLSAIESTYESMRRVLETNLMAGVICSKMAVQSMIDNSIDGHIINIGR